MNADLVCMGEPMMEFNQQPDGRYLQGHGGDTSNCAIAAARQGASVAMLTRLGHDAFGDSFMDLWAREGVATEAVQRDPQAPTGIYFVSHDEHGHRFSYYRKGSAASRISADALPTEAISGARILHVSGISLAISDQAADAVFRALELARDAGVQVSVDTNLRLNLWPLPRARAVTHEAMAIADIALPGLDDARELTALSDPDAIVDAYLAMGPGVVALTLGADATIVATPNERRRVAAWPVEAVDATAAGDTFDGAFLAELLRGADPFTAARYANAAAAISTTGFGAVAPIPHRGDVEAFMAERA